VKKLRVGILFGGKSGEHEVSLLSASSIMRAIDRDRFEVVPIGITREGRWLLSGDPVKALEEGVVREGTRIALLGDPSGRALVAVDEEDRPRKLGGVDVIFPVLHGPYGEDGSVQGLLQLADIPCVGAGVLASSVGMDKAVQKALFQQRGLRVARHAVVPSRRWRDDPEGVLDAIEEMPGYPCFVKPANLGSSIGISKVRDRAGLRRALDEASRYDRKLLVEEAIRGQEVECSVLGNDDPISSVPGEIVPNREFYDYRAKYVDGKSELIIPARLRPEVAERVRAAAVEAFRAIDCSGMARVDFFVVGGETVYVNEINTIPGFTAISMYPKLWEASGISYTDLITRLIELALERHRERSALSSRYEVPSSDDE